MAVNRLEAVRPPGEPVPDEKGKESPETPAAPPSKGTLKAWLPLALNVLLLPALAYATTTFLLLPKFKAAGQSAATAGGPGEKAEGKTGGAPGEKDAASGKGKITVPLVGKVLVNVAGTMGTRYLLANVTLVGSQPGLKELIEKNDAQLHDAAASALASKTIADLEKAGSRNLIRAELISVFNSVLGQGIVSDLYLTEFAIQ